eukprot:scaffold87551_cov55-Attheya_sp.AAC.1
MRGEREDISPNDARHSVASRPSRVEERTERKPILYWISKHPRGRNPFQLRFGCNASRGENGVPTVWTSCNCRPHRSTAIVWPSVPP